ncbi:hypothetical protein V5O48_008197 [Marasmius crinis-equi]|uniref:HMG box domain-containing protein n=1 Tax=Marasmius crinis-equi TaxID=585013 RepID=A0ABR3FEL9_9AGAR
MSRNSPESTPSGTIHVEEQLGETRVAEDCMEVDADDEDDMPPLVEKPPGHDDHQLNEEEDDQDGSLPGISVASYSALPSGGYTFIADGKDSPATGAVSTTSFQMPGALSIHHVPVGPTTSSQHEFSFSINNSHSRNYSNSNSVSHSPMTDATGELATTLASDIASAPRGRTKHHFTSDVGDSLAGDGEMGIGGGHIPRPPNAFILFRSSFIRSQKISGKVEGNHSRLSKIIGMYWRALEPAERAEWEAKAQVAQDEHRRRYPDWRFRPGSTKSNPQRGRGRRGKGGGRKGRLKTKDGGGEEDNSAEPDEVAVDVRPATSTVIDKGKGKERERDDVVRDKGKGKAREAEPDMTPQKISILIPHVPPTLKRPYHLRDRPRKASNASPSAQAHEALSSTSTPESYSTKVVPSSSSKASGSTAFAESSTSRLAGASSSKARLPLPISVPTFVPSSPPASKNTVSHAKSQQQPLQTREDLRIKQIAQLLVQGKEGIELEQELERWERGEEDSNTGPGSSDTERGSIPPSWSPEITTEPATPPSDCSSNTPSSASTTDTDAYTQRVEWNFSGLDEQPHRANARSSLHPNASILSEAQVLVDDDRHGGGRKRSSSAPAPNPRNAYQPQVPQHSASYADVSESSMEERSNDSTFYPLAERSSPSYQSWETSYEDFCDGYERQPQQSSSPFSSSPLSVSPGRTLEHDQSQRQWTYPPYPTSQHIETESSSVSQPYQMTSAFSSRGQYHRHTRTHSHLLPIQSFPSSDSEVLLSPTSPSSHSPQGSVMMSPQSAHSPVTPSSAPPNFRGVTPIQADRGANIPRRGSIAFPISSSSRSSFSHHRTITRRTGSDDPRSESGGDSLPHGSTRLTWESVEAERRQWYQTQGPEEQSQPLLHNHTYHDGGQELELGFPTPDTRDMGWVVSPHQQDSFQPFSPASDDGGPSSEMAWEQADEGRQGMVSCIVDPYLLGPREGQSEMNASSEPPPTSSYSSLSNWAGEPVVRISPPNIYDRRDKQSDIWEVDDSDVSFGLFGRRGG